jgi:hypothetical protein
VRDGNKKSIQTPQADKGIFFVRHLPNKYHKGIILDSIFQIEDF